MRLVDIVAGPWAITPEMYVEIQGIYARHMRGEKINLADIEARVGAPLANVRREYAVDQGVAVIDVFGVLAKRMNLFMQISGGTSMEILASQIRSALEDPAVNSIILATDSPGGTVDGTQELADMIHAARGTKPIIAHASGTMASAAYWIGSAADQIFVNDMTTSVGSIGVVATHVDMSGREAQFGIKTTEITAGKYKRIASQYEPLSQEGRADIQAKVDHLYSVFVEDVARNRGVSTDAVLEKMADGRVFIGKQSIEAGLVDGVATLTDLIGRAAAGDFAGSAANKKATSGVGATPKAEANETRTQMNIETLKAEHPDIAKALHEEGFAAGKAAGAEEERARIKAVEEQVLPGHEALIAGLKFDGKTTGEMAAVAVLNAERAKLGDRRSALKQDVNDVASVPAATAPEDEGKKKEAEEASPAVIAAAAKEYQTKAAAEGRKVSAAEAVDYVTRNMKEGK